MLALPPNCPAQVLPNGQVVQVAAAPAARVDLKQPCLIFVNDVRPRQPHCGRQSRHFSAPRCLVARLKHVVAAAAHVGGWWLVSARRSRLVWPQVSAWPAKRHGMELKVNVLRRNQLPAWLVAQPLAPAQPAAQGPAQAQLPPQAQTTARGAAAAWVLLGASARRAAACRGLRRGPYVPCVSSEPQRPSWSPRPRLSPSARGRARPRLSRQGSGQRPSRATAAARPPRARPRPPRLPSRDQPARRLRQARARRGGRGRAGPRRRRARRGRRRDASRLRLRAAPRGKGRPSSGPEWRLASRRRWELRWHAAGGLGQARVGGSRVAGREWHATGRSSRGFQACLL
jgi:hypothetical protein